MPDQESDSQFMSTYQGRRVHFCCADCIRRFEADPELYAGNLPPPKPVNLPPEPWSDYLLRHLQPVVDAADYAAVRPWFTGYTLAVILLSAIAMRKRRRLAAGKVRPRWSDGLSRPFARPTASAALLLLGLSIQLIADSWFRHTALAAVADHADMRTTPSGAVSTFAWPQALHELPRGLSNVYYRGNDERSEKLFNGGRYRTATFHVSIRTEDGQELKPGMEIGSRAIILHFRIVRAANTAPGFYTKDRMSIARLHRPPGPDGKAESFPLTTIREEWEWEVMGRIGTPTVKGYEGFRGVWFLGSEGAEPHFAIQYVIHLRDGKVLPESVVWMYSVLQSPILDGPTADAEWFSDRPIPEIPDGKSVTDPKLLGLTKPAPKKDGKK